MREQVTIITGAAKGIGAAIATRLVAEGHVAVLLDVDDKAGNALAAQLGRQAHFLHADITDERRVGETFGTVMDRFGRVDTLVNNAGIAKDNVIWKMPTEDFDSVVDINLKGTWLMCKHAAIVMRQQQHGRIVNLASRAWLGNPGQTNYSASKAGVIGLTRALALELGKHGVMVNAVAPGLIDTPLTQALTAEVKQRLIATQPLRTMGRPEDIAQVVAFLCDERTKYITGQTLYVDGGKSIGAGL
ncbi:MAG: SDR family oxidoreductase [Flavobacteriales bacterium]|nr:SDR family oxidoreductase [Flavobacteriales bacterium]